MNTSRLAFVKVKILLFLSKNRQKSINSKKFINFNLLSLCGGSSGATVAAALVETKKTQKGPNLRRPPRRFYPKLHDQTLETILVYRARTDSRFRARRHGKLVVRKNQQYSIKVCHRFRLRNRYKRGYFRFEEKQQAKRVHHKRRRTKERHQHEHDHGEDAKVEGQEGRQREDF